MLYPSYEFVTTTNVNSKFILEYDICDQATKNKFDFRYNDAIIISNRLFDELWNEDKLKEKVIEFARVRFKSRRRTIKTIDTEGSDFVEELKAFAFLQSDVEEVESPIINLFNLYGSSAFYPAYMQVLEKEPFPKVRAALITFIQKVIIGESSLFYRKKNKVLGSKIKSNFLKAYSSYREMEKDQYGLSFLKFLKDLLV